MTFGRRRSWGIVEKAFVGISHNTPRTPPPRATLAGRTKETHKRDLEKRRMSHCGISHNTPRTPPPQCDIRATLRVGQSSLGVVRVVQSMGWLRLVGSLKKQVSFAKYRLFYRALLQKRPIILRSLLIVATPYSLRIVSD